MIVLDASVLIAHLDGHDVHHRRAEDLLTELADEEFGASPITIAEVLVGPARADRLDDARDALEQLGVAPIPLDDDAHVELAKLRATTNLRLPDCWVLLSAHTRRAGIATFDERLGTVARERRTVAHDGVGDNGDDEFGEPSELDADH